MNNPAGLSAAEVAELQRGGPVGNMRWLYPYEGTVFPSGTAAPLLMWQSQAAPDVVYLQIRSRAFEYKGVLRPTLDGALFVPQLSVLGGSFDATGLFKMAGTELGIPRRIWDAACAQSLGSGDPFTLELTQRVQGQIAGPIALHISIAAAAVKGSLYYNTCGSALNDSTPGGLVRSQVLRIAAGGNAERLLSSGDCEGCHSVSADGSRLITQRVTGYDDPRAVSFNGEGRSYPLSPEAKPDVARSSAIGPNASYGALYPDGSAYIAAALPFYSAGDKATNIGGALYGAPSLPLGVGPLLYPATLIDTSSGQVIADTGIPESAAMPMLSPDGTLLVFNDIAIDDARGLVVMNYDTIRHKASERREVMREQPGSASRPGWPFFLPNAGALVFERTESPLFTAGSGTAAAGNSMVFGSAGTASGAASDLHITDLARGTTTLLAKAMGFDTAEAARGDKTYLPFGAQDLHRNNYPAVSPIAAGGYYWVFFDSFRHFGTLGARRGLWGFAIDVRADGDYSVDRSHPPFFVPGQEFGTSNNNHRAFAARDACRPDGSVCGTGVDCCSGMCASGTTPAAGLCQPPEDRCAKLDERCAQRSDCCSLDYLCINGFCALALPD